MLGWRDFWTETSSQSQSPQLFAQLSFTPAILAACLPPIFLRPPLRNEWQAGWELGEEA